MDPYKEAGVNVNSGYEISNFVKNNLSGNNKNNIGNFGGIFEIPQGYKEPLLISGNDGVGTKLLLATLGNKHDTVGIDCVAMCVNDILAQGAKPLYFLDYIATGKTDDKVKEILSGILKGCQLGELSLIGGETAEMPDMYLNNTYDLAGFGTGIVEKNRILTPRKVKAGDKLIGIGSDGLHSNGFSLIRKIFFKDHGLNYDSKIKEFPNQKIGDLLLEPTHIYTKQMLPLIDNDLIHGASHITGGGFYENIPRMLPEQLMARIDLKSWPIPTIFKVVQEYGNISKSDMFHIFNMGIGMVLAVDPSDEEDILNILCETGQLSFTIGEVVRDGTRKIEFVGGIK